MGRWDKEMAYVVCKNPCCPGNPAGGSSWRRISRGPDACRSCKTPFRIPINKKSDGGDDGGGWYRYNSKGRVREDKGNESAKPQQSSKKPERQQVDVQEHNDAKLEAEFRARWKDDAEKLEIANRIWPPKPKSPEDMLQEAIEKAEQCETEAKHLAKVHNDMFVSLGKKADELLQYQDRVEEKKKHMTEAQDALGKARQELDKLKTEQTKSPQIAAPVSTASRQLLIAQAYNPIESLTQDLQNDPLIISMGQEAALSHLDKLVNRFKEHMNCYAATIHNADPSALAAAFPTSSVSGGNQVGVGSGGDNGGGIGGNGGHGGNQQHIKSAPPDAIMTAGQVKRHASEALLDDAVGFDTDDIGQQGVSSLSGSAASASANGQGLGGVVGVPTDGCKHGSGQDGVDSGGNGASSEDQIRVTIQTAANAASQIQAFRAIAAEAVSAE